MSIVARAGACTALMLSAGALVAAVGPLAGVEILTAEVRREVQATPASARAPAAPRPPRLMRSFPPAAPGIGVIDRGMRLAIAEPLLPAGRADLLRFRLSGGRARRVLLTVVRHDARHLRRSEARQERGGDWVADVRLPRAGTYRVIADVDGGRRIMGADLFAAGAFEPVAVPAPAGLVRVSGYNARLRSGGGVLRLAVERGGRPVDALPAGPLVAVRTGDLAYTTVDPARSRLRFAPAYPGPGTYRLFVPFADGDRIVTAAFTREVRR